MSTRGKHTDTCNCASISSIYPVFNWINTMGTVRKIFDTFLSCYFFGCNKVFDAVRPLLKLNYFMQEINIEKCWQKVRKSLNIPSALYGLHNAIFIYNNICLIFLSIIKTYFLFSFHIIKKTLTTWINNYSFLLKSHWEEI